MSRKKNKNSKTLSQFTTLIEDPYQFKTIEIIESQNLSEELNLDSDLNKEEQDPIIISEFIHESLTIQEDEQEVHQEQEPELEQNEAEESKENVNEFTEADTVSLDEQFDQLAKAISEKIENETIEPSLPLKSNLAEQIAEEEALKDEIARQEQEVKDAQGSITEEINLDLAEIQSCIETLLYLADKPLSTEKLRDMLGPNYSLDLFQSAISALEDRYRAVHHGIELVSIAGGYQFRTKPGRSALAQKLVKVQTQRLSSGCMETLSIVAYRQPVMKEDIDKVRGVDSSYFIRTLLEKKLIRISGRSELPGRPMLYVTTDEFLEVFGLRDLSALPSLRELEQMIPASQTNNPEDEDPRIKEMRRLVGEMKSDTSSALYYNPKEDDKILKDIREQVNSIPTSTPYLDELKAAELAAEAQAQLEAQGQIEGQTHNPGSILSGQAPNAKSSPTPPEEVSNPDPAPIH